MTGTATSPYLEGVFAPVATETTATRLTVTGTLPPELDGRLLRIGPNPIGPQDPATFHWFTGPGLVHGVRLVDGRAEWYRSRFVRSDRVTQAFGWPTTPGPRHGVGDGTANTNVIAHAGRTLAVVEAGSLPVDLTDDLETVARTDLDHTLPGSFTAHPKRDPVTGELHAVAYFWGWEHLQYLVVGTDGRVRRTVDVPVVGGPMVHDCAITDRFVALLDLQCRFDLSVAAAGGFPYRWDPSATPRIGLLPREGGAADVVWCDLDDPGYVFHPLNAYDDTDGTVVLDVVRHPAVFATDLAGPNEGPTRLERWRCDPGRRTVRVDVRSDVPLEFPRHDERLVGRRHRFGYGVELAFPADGPFAPRGLVKVDVDAATTERRVEPPHRSWMEAVFVPRHADAAEDDGWLLGYVHDAERDAADVVVLDAADIGGDPVAVVRLPVRVPYGFHGNWVPTGS